jgi:hypothetical protein
VLLGSLKYSGGRPVQCSETERLPLTEELRMTRAALTRYACIAPLAGCATNPATGRKEISGQRAVPLWQ